MRRAWSPHLVEVVGGHEDDDAARGELRGWLRGRRRGCAASMPVNGSSSRTTRGSWTQCAREEDALLLAPGELADVPAAHAAEAEPLERRFGARWRSSRPGPPQPADGAVAAHEHDVERGHRELPVHVLALGDEGDARRRGPRSGAPPRMIRRRAHGRTPAIALRSVLLPPPFGPDEADHLAGLDARTRRRQGRRYRRSQPRHR